MLRVYQLGPVACRIDAMLLLNWESGIISIAGSGTVGVVPGGVEDGVDNSGVSKEKLRGYVQGVAGTCAHL